MPCDLFGCRRLRARCSRWQFSICQTGTELAFNALHGTFGEDGTIQAILDEKGIPYTGEGEAGSRLAFDKIASKERFLAMRSTDRSLYYPAKRRDP